MRGSASLPCGAAGGHYYLLDGAPLHSGCTLPHAKRAADLCSLTTPFLHVKYAGPVLNKGNVVDLDIATEQCIETITTDLELGFL